MVSLSCSRITLGLLVSLLSHHPIRVRVRALFSHHPILSLGLSHTLTLTVAGLGLSRIFLMALYYTGSMKTLTSSISSSRRIALCKM